MDLSRSRKLNKALLVAWIFMLLAIVTEVTGVSIIKMADEFGALISYAGMLSMITLSYYCLSLAAKKIPIGIAYSIWEGVGLVLVTLVAVFFFREQLSTQQLLGIGLVIVGIIMVTLGETHE